MRGEYILFIRRGRAITGHNEVTVRQQSTTHVLAATCRASPASCHTSLFLSLSLIRRPSQQPIRFKPSTKMPYLDDAAMDAETLTAMPVELDDVDLFGDPVLGEAVSLTLPPATHGKKLVQRIDELRSRGCCQLVSPFFCRPSTADQDPGASHGQNRAPSRKSPLTAARSSSISSGYIPRMLLGVSVNPPLLRSSGLTSKAAPLFTWHGLPPAAPSWPSSTRWGESAS